MVRLTELNHQVLINHIRPGDVAIDATCGNGHDTLFLSKSVGDTGKVLACDLQLRAIQETRQRCTGQDNVEFLTGNHAEVLASLRGEYGSRVAAVLFNLGYLPGGDKTQTTTVETTVRALNESFELLRSGGVLSVLAYVGHQGGAAEEVAVRGRFDDWIQAGAFKIVHQPESDIAEQSPRLFIGTKCELDDATQF